MNRVAQTYVAVVDDDDSVCRSLARLLRASGIHAVVYLSGEAFLADTKQPKFDCLVFDIQLGGMSGIELHQTLKASGSTTPVIYITAHDDPATEEKAMATGCSAYLRKHQPGEAVLAAIRQAANLPTEPEKI